MKVSKPIIFRTRILIFPEHIPIIGKTAKPHVVCIQHEKRRQSMYWCSEREAGLHLDYISRATIETSISNPAASIAHMQHPHVR